MPTLHWKSKKEKDLTPADFAIFNNSYPGGKGYPPGDSIQQPNRLFLGDNLKAMTYLLTDYEGRVNLIYADPPFYTNRLYSARVGQGEDSRRPQEWQLEEGYKDDWPDLESYLDMLYPRLKLMHRLLAEDGTLYLHLDWHANSYARILLDEIFSPERLLNEIVWIYHGPSPIKSAFNRKHDTILVYTKSKDYYFNADEVRQPYDPSTIKTFNSSPKAGFGKLPDLNRGKVPEDWWYFPVVARLHNERTGYPTQKPEALLERILRASSKPGDLVADFFCGSGTTPVIAERLNRNYIAADITWRAIHTTRKRLMSSGVQPFQIMVEKGIDINPGRINSDYKFELIDESIRLNTQNLEDIDYWEVDPNWKGNTFNSVVQAVRPRKKRPIETRIDLPTESIGNRYCVRLVEVKGKQLQTVMEKL